MKSDRPFRAALFLFAAALLATMIGAKPLYAVEADSAAAGAKKTDQQKKTVKESKEKKSRETTAPSATNRYPNDNVVPGMGY
jgi:hypothetical protein